MAGSMVGSVIAMMGSVGDRVAHGGPIVAVLGAVDNVLMFFVAIAAGAFVAAIIVNFLKKDVALVEDSTGAELVATEEKFEQQREKDSEVVVEEVRKLTDITSLNLINTQLIGNTRDEIIDEMIAKLDSEGALTSREEFKQAIINRENESSTGIGMNIAIPHGKSDAVTKPRVVFGIKQDGVDWKSLDGTEAKLIFMIAVPKTGQGDAHLKILQMLSRKLMDDTFRDQLLAAQSEKEAFELLGEIE
jgi:PTS system fructose-specific IIC component